MFTWSDVSLHVKLFQSKLLCRSLSLSLSLCLSLAAETCTVPQKHFLVVHTGLSANIVWYWKVFQTITYGCMFRGYKLIGDKNRTCLPGGKVSGSGSLTCQNIDECIENVPPPCNPHASCTDTIGSYSCSCKAGFQGDGVTCNGKMF